MMQKAATLLAGLVLAGGVTGCWIQTEKGANGKDKKVQVDTPFGGVHVNTGQTTATDLGLPVYPGAVAVKSEGDHKSADVRLGFGQWELRVRAVSYESSDSEDQVAAFYKKALSRYGDVITCRGHVAVGSPTVTSEGLSCVDDKNAKVQIDRGDYGVDKETLELKAGSKRHQHIMGFENPKIGKTRFALVALDLPAGSDSSSSGKSD